VIYEHKEEEKTFREVKKLEGISFWNEKIHSAFSTDLNRNLFLLDEKNMYHFDLTSIVKDKNSHFSYENHTFKDLYIVKIKLFHNLLYVLHNSYNETREGSS